MRSPDHDNPAIQAMLQDVMGNPVTAHWSRDKSTYKTRVEPGSVKRNVGLSLPHGCTLQGMLYLPGSQSSDVEMVMSRLRVNPKIREHGISIRLISALGHLAKQHQASVLIGHMESQYVAMGLRKVFGEASLRYATQPREPLSVDLPMTTPEAIGALEMLEEYETNLEDRDLGFGFIVDLTQVPTSSLEIPVIQ